MRRSGACGLEEISLSSWGKHQGLNSRERRGGLSDKGQDDIAPAGVEEDLSRVWLFWWLGPHGRSQSRLRLGAGTMR